MIHRSSSPSWSFSFSSLSVSPLALLSLRTITTSLAPHQAQQAATRQTLALALALALAPELAPELALELAQAHPPATIPASSKRTPDSTAPCMVSHIPQRAPFPTMAATFVFVSRLRNPSRKRIVLTLHSQCDQGRPTHVSIDQAHPPLWF